VLAARGSELERAFSYGVVRQLFEPFLARLPEKEQTELLAGTAALTTPLFDPAQFAAEHATDALLARLTASTGWRRTSPPAGRFCLRSTMCTGATHPRCAGWRMSSRGWRDSTL
jgi:hypothetical protein